MSLKLHTTAVLKSWPFFFAMKAAAGLSLFRGLIVAASLNISNFTDYSVILATGYFLAFLLSFGLVEGTIKEFPRLVNSKQSVKMQYLARILIRKITIRALILFLASILIGHFFYSSKLLSFYCVPFLALTASYTSVIASVQRAVGKSIELSSTNLIRSVLAFALVVGASLQKELIWILVAEISAAFIGFTVSCYISNIKLSIKYVFFATPRKKNNAHIKFMSNGGGYVTLTYIILSIPYYLDRLYVAATFMIEDAARYSVITLLLTAGVLISNTIAQRMGAEVVKISTTLGKKMTAIYVTRWSFTSIIFWSIFMSFLGILFHLKLTPNSLNKYDIGTSYLIPIFAMGALAITGIIEFLLIAIDAEKEMFYCASGYLFLIIFASLLCRLMGADMLVWIWALILVRCIYLISLVIFFANHKPPKKHEFKNQQNI